VALGTYGSTLTSELNRLANGGTYPAISAYVDQAAAARAWAAQRSVTLTVTTQWGCSIKLRGLRIKRLGLTTLVYVIISLALLAYLQRQLSERSLPDECEI